MTLYARVEAGQITTEMDFVDPPPDMTRKGFQWFPVIITNPPVDPATQIKTGPVLSIVGQTVTKVWTVRPKTAQELDTDKDIIISGMDFAILTAIFDHENRVRALEGKAAITVAQFKAAIKARLP